MKMMMHKALHPRGGVDRLYVSRKRGSGSPALRIALMCQDKVSSSTLKRAKKWILAALNNTIRIDYIERKIINT